MKLGADEAEASAARRKETVGEARLRGIGHGYVRFALADPGHFRVMFRPELKRQLNAGESVTIVEAFDILQRAVARCQEEGTIPAGDPRRIVLLAWASVHGASALWLDGPLPEEGLVDDARALETAVADTLMELLRGRDAAPRRRS